ncbi:hypothetical protein EV426DRAFT_601374, partial [Tirmania nivea]
HCLLSPVFVLGYCPVSIAVDCTLTNYVLLAMPYVLTQLLMSVPAAATSIAYCPRSSSSSACACMQERTVPIHVPAVPCVHSC